MIDRVYNGLMILLIDRSQWIKTGNSVDLIRLDYFRIAYIQRKHIQTYLIIQNK